MPVLTAYRHGCTAGIPPTVNTHQRAKREEVKGWSDSSTRRNTRFLYSVDETQLTGYGLAFTGTLKTCPPTHTEWHKICRAFFMRLQRMGLIRAHWLTEWQRRGVPHLHMALWLETFNPFHPEIIRGHWLYVAREYGAERHGQHIVGINDTVGWFKYLSKHAVRGLGHYQRSPENIPAGWKKTGRMWGKLGTWDTTEPVRFLVENEGFYAFRRIIQRWRLADARSAGDPARIRAAKRMLQHPDRNTCQVRGVSEWVTYEVTAQVVAFLASQGHPVSC